MGKLRIHIIALVVSLCVGGLVSVHLGQDINYDLLNYHYYTPHALLNGRLDFDIAPAQHQNFQNPLIDVPAYLLLSSFKPIIAGALLGALHGLALWLVFEISLLLLSHFKLKEWHRIGMSALISLCSLTGAATLSELGGTMGDNLSGVFVLLAFWLLILSLRDGTTGRRAQYFRLAAYFSVGLSLGFKLTNLMFGVGLLLAGVLADKTWRKKTYNTILHSVSMGLGTLLAGGVWYVYLWKTVGNPIFPFYNAFFKSPYYPAVNFLDTRWFPEGEKQILFYPFYFIKEQNLVVEIPFKDPRLAVLYAALIVTGIFFVVRKLVLKKPLLPTWNKSIWAFWIFILTSYVLWQKQFSNYRYLIVIELLSLLGIAILSHTVIKNKYLASAATLVALILIPLNTNPINWGRVPWQKEYFGPSLSQQLQVPAGSVVLMAGGDPFSYLVPYFPKDTRVIRVDSNMLTPATKQPSAQFEKVVRAINQEEAEGGRFYGVLTNDELSRQTEALRVYGYEATGCKPITTHANTYIFKGGMHVQLCSLIERS